MRQNRFTDRPRPCGIPLCGKNRCFPCPLWRPPCGIPCGGPCGFPPCDMPCETPPFGIPQLLLKLRCAIAAACVAQSINRQLANLHTICCTRTRPLSARQGQGSARGHCASCNQSAHGSAQAAEERKCEPASGARVWQQVLKYLQSLTPPAHLSKEPPPWSACQCHAPISAKATASA